MTFRLSGLTPVEHQWLWLHAMGRSDHEKQRLTGTTASWCTANRIRTKLGAINSVHAVYLACEREFIGPRIGCGSMDGVREHQAGNEDLCHACRRVNGVWVENETHLARRPVPELNDHERRFLDLLATGINAKEIKVKLDKTHASMEYTRRTLYKKLGVRPDIPFGSRRYYALMCAEQLGLIEGRTPSEASQRRTDRKPKVVRLTDLEVRTLAVINKGGTLPVAGAELGISATSLAARLSGIYKKLGLGHVPRDEKRAAAVKAARDMGHQI